MVLEGRFCGAIVGCRNRRASCAPKENADAVLRNAPLSARRSRSPSETRCYSVDFPRCYLVNGHCWRRSRSGQGPGPEAMGTGLYANFMMDDEGEARVKAAYGDNYQRLAAQ